MAILAQRHRLGTNLRLGRCHRELFFEELIALNKGTVTDGIIFYILAIVTESNQAKPFINH